MMDTDYYLTIRLDDEGHIWLDNTNDDDDAISMQIPFDCVERLINELTIVESKYRALYGQYQVGDYVRVDDHTGQIQSIFTPTALEPQYNVYFYGKGTRTVRASDMTLDR